MPGGSPWLKTKKEGEEAVFAEFPEATIFRPCEMYGFNDHLVRYYNSWWRKSFGAKGMSLWKKGTETMRSPLFVEDLTSGIMAALDDPGTRGMIFEAMGPEKFLQADLCDWMHEVMHKDPEDWGYRRMDLRFDPFTFGKSVAGTLFPFGFSLKYFKSPTLERLERSQLNEVSEGYPSITDLGVKLHKVEDKMPWELLMFRAFQDHEYRYLFLNYYV